MSYSLKFEDKIPKNRAVDRIFVHAKYGNHFNDYRPETKSELQEYFQDKGVNTDQLLEWIGDPKKPVPEFANYIGSTWNTSGGIVKQKDASGDIINELQGPSKVIFSRYQSHFETACDARDRAVANVSYSELQTCLTQGLTSIDNFFNECANQWNKDNPNNPLEDNQNLKVKLETKIDEWLPIISNGKTIDKSVRQWRDFKKLKKLRDEEAVHPKSSAGGIELNKLAEYLNAFRYGMALLLGNIHLHIGRYVPSIIIDAHYMSDVIVVEG